MKDYNVKSIDYFECKEWLLKKHYAKRIPVIQYSFGLFYDNLIVGVCTYGVPPQNNCTLICGEKNSQYVIELNRLIKNDNLHKNVQSWFVSQTLKLLPKPKIILSYADPNNGHIGYTYQALNFLYVGNGGMSKEYIFNKKQYSARHINKNWFLTKKLNYNDSLTIDENFILNSGEIIKMKPKNRYVYVNASKKLKKKLINDIKWDIEKYPKGDNKRYDTSYKPVTQTKLF